MKHNKEFYILIGVAIIIPILISAGVIIIQDKMYPVESQTKTGDHGITFMLTNKHTDGFNNSWISFPSSNLLEAHDFYLMNRTEFDGLEFNKIYSCNVSWDFLPWLNTTLSDCHE